MSPSHSPQGSISKAPILNRSSPSVQSNKLKWVSLVVLIAQTTALVLILRYSRMPSKKTDTPEGKDAPENVKYLSSTAVLMAEIIKFFTCILVLLIHNKWNIDRFYKEIDLDILRKGRDTMKVGVPALLYVVQNNLLFLALSKLDAATYQVTYQLKILTTAFCSVAMLGKRLDKVKWISLLLLTAGVGLVQLPKDKPQTEKQVDEAGRLVGLFAVIAACFSSGFAGVYFEKILKTSVVSLWIRNLQLAFFSIFGGFFMTWLYDWEAVQENGFFQGYNWVIWVVVLLQAYGGLVIALVVKYADNILKGFAVSLSIILSSLISWYMGDFESSLAFFIGTTVVIISTFMYGYEPKTPQQAHSA
ncbi:nucleotide-sugar transporter domain-containing protein [Ditylenchus destructor]|nr:nucleotide-sugar transporter domain-containing protein [Ditylenchus destructor]